MFTIYHDAIMFENDVYKYIIGPGYTKNVNPFFDKRNTPVITYFIFSKDTNQLSNIADSEEKKNNFIQR